nr:hypothetical protein [uncultured Victivallis sp.]
MVAEGPQYPGSGVSGNQKQAGEVKPISVNVFRKRQKTAFNGIVARRFRAVDPDCLAAVEMCKQSQTPADSPETADRRHRTQYTDPAMAVFQKTVQRQQGIISVIIIKTVQANVAQIAIFDNYSSRQFLNPSKQFKVDLRHPVHDDDIRAAAFQLGTERNTVPEREGRQFITFQYPERLTKFLHDSSGFPECVLLIEIDNGTSEFSWPHIITAAAASFQATILLQPGNCRHDDAVAYPEFPDHLPLRIKTFSRSESIQFVPQFAIEIFLALFHDQYPFFFRNCHDYNYNSRMQF